MLLYKYRGLSAIEFALDIFVNQQLYAANFKSLNDPMEGRYVYNKGLLDKQALRKIRGEKNAYNIVSLSKTYKNMVMWSYYAEGHSGFVVGVNVIEDDVMAKPVTYVPELRVQSKTGDVAKRVLMKKLALWEHEQEYRVLVPKQSFVRIEVKELIFGTESSKPNNKVRRDLVEAVARKFCPGIKVTTMSRRDLDKGDVRVSEV